MSIFFKKTHYTSVKIDVHALMHLMHASIYFCIGTRVIRRQTIRLQTIRLQTIRLQTIRLQTIRQLLILWQIVVVDGLSVVGLSDPWSRRIVCCRIVCRRIVSSVLSLNICAISRTLFSREPVRTTNLFNWKKNFLKNVPLRWAEVSINITMHQYKLLIIDVFPRRRRHYLCIGRTF
jgi:hypothetical protein